MYLRAFRKMVTLAQTNSLVKEITIKVPWGQIAAKWWGPSDIRPVVCLHGRGDNAGSFDPLIPLLPNHLSYLAVDVPGHGLSTRIPDGQAYTLINFLYWIHLIRKHFDWEHISLMGHSMSAAHCFLYAGLYPDNCDMLILLDTLKPLYGNGESEMMYLREVINSTYVADLRNQSDSEPPSYTREEIIEKITHKTFYSEISREGALHLLRGLIESKQNPGKYYLPLDRRIQNTYPQLSNAASIHVARAIRAPFCFIKTRGSQIIHFYEKDILKIVKKNPQFEMHLVDGDHHIHLNDPKVVCKQVSNFICKYRPIATTNSSAISAIKSNL